MTAIPVGHAQQGEAAQPSLKRVMGPWLLLLFIIGDVLGTGIYALTGQVAKQVGGAVWLPFVVAFAVALITAFSYLELVTEGRFPHRMLRKPAARHDRSFRRPGGGRGVLQDRVDQSRRAPCTCTTPSSPTTSPGNSRSTCTLTMSSGARRTRGG
jgi:hypothetical protein